MSEETKEAHVAKLIETAITAGLAGADWASRQGCARLASAYNGIGPAFLPESVRARVTSFLVLFEPAALIHDMRFASSDGTRAGFEAANSEFLDNCFALADRAYPWYNWKRYRARAAAAGLYDAVSSVFGWRSWEESGARGWAQVKASLTNEKETP